MAIEVTKDKFEEWLDEAGKTALAGLFQNFRTDEFAEPLEKDIAQMRVGLKRLRADLEIFGGLIDETFAG